MGGCAASFAPRRIVDTGKYIRYPNECLLKNGKLTYMGADSQLWADAGITLNYGLLPEIRSLDSTGGVRNRLRRGDSGTTATAVGGVPLPPHSTSSPPFASAPDQSVETYPSVTGALVSDIDI